MTGARDRVIEALTDFGASFDMLGPDLGGQIRQQLQAFIDLLKHADAVEWKTVAEALKTGADGFTDFAKELEKADAGAASEVAFKIAGVLDFAAEPEMNVWGGPFNGQTYRQSIFTQLARELEVTAIVETGTFRGTSTAFMAGFGLPVFSCEHHPRFFQYSLQRVGHLPNVTLAASDSRPFLRGLFDEKKLPAGRTLFYLDAHWEEDLPLWEEIDLIFAQQPQAVIIIDDFRVPRDLGYGYDDYGWGKCLSVSNLYEVAFTRPSLFFPNQPSGHETGVARGCVVLALGETAGLIGRQVTTLSELSWQDALAIDGIAEVRAKMEVGRKRSKADRAELDATKQAVTEMQQSLAEIGATVQQLYTEIHAARAEAGRIAQLQNYIDRLQYTRWRRLGIMLKLEKRIAIE